MGNTARPQSGNRPLIQAMASQQKTIEDQKRQIAVQALQLAYIARVAGVTAQMEEIRKAADIENPAQPVPNPPSEPAVESTEEAVTPEAYDNPNQIGQTPGANEHVPAAAVDTPLAPGTTLPTSPYNELVNVSAPVAGTETHVAPDMTRIETDVRVGDPMNPETAFPLNPSALGPSQQQGTTPPRSGEMSQTAGNRTMASLRLARLRLSVGTATGDDLEVAARIEANASLSDASIRTQIETLESVVKAAGTRTASQRPAGVVPRSAPQRQVQRTMPSLVAQPAPQPPITSVAGAVGAIDTEAEDVFL